MAQDDIQGQVVDPSGNPVSGAIVELTRSYESNPVEEQTVLRTTTNSNGNYIFEEHPDSDGTTQDYHVSCYNHDGTTYVNSFNNPGVTADLSPAIPVSDIANFESGSLDPSFNGATGDYEVSSTSPTLTGVFSLKSTVSGPGSISSESGFDNYPQQGQRFACYVYMGSTKSTSNGLGIGWASQDPDNMFVVTISEKGGGMEVFELNNGAFSSNLASQSVSLNRFEWYDIEVEWTTSGGITARVFDVDQTTGDRLGSALAEVTTTSTSYTSGGVGFIGFGGGTRSRFDNYRILEEL